MRWKRGTAGISARGGDLALGRVMPRTWVGFLAEGMKDAGAENANGWRQTI